AQQYDESRSRCRRDHLRHPRQGRQAVMAEPRGNSSAASGGGGIPAGGIPAINPWLVAIAVMSATFMEVLDTTVVNVSLPHISGSLSATPEEATWALTSYLVAIAIFMPLTGLLAGSFGR